MDGSGRSRVDRKHDEDVGEGSGVPVEYRVVWVPRVGDVESSSFGVVATSETLGGPRTVSPRPRRYR